MAMVTACGGAPPDGEPAVRDARQPLRAPVAAPRLLGTPGAFGRTLALSGDLLAVAAWLQPRGTVSIYERDGGAWRALQRIDGGGSFYGRSLALRDDTLAVGDPEAGQVSVYRRSGAEFRLEVTLSASEGGSTFFGEAVALEGGTLFVGAPAEMGGGSIHLYRRAFRWGPWVEIGALTAPERVPWDLFGEAIAVSGDVLVASLRGGRPAAALAFHRGPEGWTPEARLVEPADDADVAFGLRVAVSGNVAVVNCDCGDGEVYVYERTPSGWVLAAAWSKPVETTGSFGHELAVSGSSLVVTTPFEAVAGIPGAGLATLYQRTRAGWIPVAEFTAPFPAAADGFGHGLAIGGGLVVVGAPGLPETEGEVFTWSLRELARRSP
jgi:hypothetical protein